MLNLRENEQSDIFSKDIKIKAARYSEALEGSSSTASGQCQIVLQLLDQFLGALGLSLLFGCPKQ